ncbi:MAG TPA: hypothetical protein VLX32_04745 [Candidatus Acidoferrum sp.]|nr:hypothetical protein [Candidatus Acidoferrum sp.]
MASELIEKWKAERREHAEKILREAQATLRSVRATASHNCAPEWKRELARCERNVGAAEAALAELSEEL